jgi:hypothetical protein
MSLEYKEFNDDFYIVECDKDKFHDFFEPIGAKSYKSGFLISRDNENQLKKIINFINIRENGKPRKQQTRFRREYSDDNEEDDDVKKVENKVKYKKSDPKSYYKSFNSKPVDFKKINRLDNSDNSDDDDDYSSSSHHSSSSDGFPSPSTPGRRYTSHEMEELYDIINGMQRKINFLEKRIK